MSKVVDFTQYGGFQSYGIKPISTAKPGISNQYQKDAYKDISNYNRRKVNFYEDKVRWNSVYDKDTIKTIKESDYANTANDSRATLNKYEYCHDENLSKIIQDGNNKNVEKIRQRHAQSTEGFRKKMFSNWTSTYDYETQKSLKIREENNFAKATIPNWFKNKHHEYHRATYKTDHMGGMGIHGDNPQEKYSKDLRSQQVEDKLFSDNYDIALGTSKASNFLPGYSGFISTNKIEHNDTQIKDPFFNVIKTNHVLNYSTRLPGYSGYVPFNSMNKKGNPRPNCLTTNGETFS